MRWHPRRRRKGYPRTPSRARRRDRHMSETQNGPLQHLEPLGDAIPFVGKMHALIARSPLFENFNLPELRLLAHFMEVYRSDSGIQIIREGDAGDFLMLILEG